MASNLSGGFFNTKKIMLNVHIQLCKSIGIDILVKKKLSHLQTISEKCSLLVWVPHNILNYLSIQNLLQKRSRQSIYLSIHKKIFILFFNFINDINMSIYIYLKTFLSNFYKYYFECTQ